MYNTWLEHIMLLFQGCSVVITAGILLFSIPALRQNLLERNTNIKIQFAVVVLFSVLAIYGTHAGKVVKLDGALIEESSGQLSGAQAVINFRDIVVVTAGLAAGPWCGLAVGTVAGVERYMLGGFTALPCALASILCGVFAGYMRQRNRTMLTPFKASLVGASSVGLQMGLILLLARPLPWAVEFVQQTGVPVLLTATIACYAFQQVLYGLGKIHSDLTARQIEVRAQRAEIRALHAQIEPHFLMNVLNAIKALIRLDQDKARHYVTLLAEFLRDTRAYAVLDLIEISDELSHLRKYLDFQQLRFEKKVNYREIIENEKLLKYKLPPRTLLTLVENSLIHGFSSEQNEYQITIHISQDNDRLEILISDNGVGIEKNKLPLLGKKPVDSKKSGGGLGIYHLQKTLNEFYNDANVLAISNNPTGIGARVKISIPA